MNEECTNPAANTEWTPTSEQLKWMQGELAAEFPDLNVAVTMRDASTIYIEAVPA